MRMLIHILALICIISCLTFAVTVSIVLSICTLAIAKLSGTYLPSIRRRDMLLYLKDCVAYINKIRDSECSCFESLWVDLPTAKRVHMLHWSRIRGKRKANGMGRLGGLGKAPLLCIPGTGSYSMCYIDFIQSQEAYDEIYVVDMPGWGISDSLEGIDLKKDELDAIHDRYAQLIAELYCHIRALRGVTAVDILAHSLGAFLTVQCMRRHALVLEDSHIRLLCMPGLTTKMSPSDWFWSWLIRYSLPERLLKQWDIWHCVRWWCRGSDPLTWFCAVALLNPEGEGYEVLGRHMTIGSGSDKGWAPLCLDDMILAMRYGKMQVTMIWGEHDTLVSIKDRPDIMKQLRDEGIESRIVDAGHSMNEDPYALGDALMAGYSCHTFL